MRLKIEMNEDACVFYWKGQSFELCRGMRSVLKLSLYILF